MVKNLPAIQETRVQSLGREDLLRRKWQPTPVFLPGKSHGWRSLVGCSPWGRTQLDTTERLHFHFSLSCIGEGNGNPLQCSCLENPRDSGAWWAAVYGVAQSRTRLKRLRSSSSVYILKKSFPIMVYHRILSPGVSQACLKLHSYDNMDKKRGTLSKETIISN